MAVNRKVCGQNNVGDLCRLLEGKVLTHVHRQMSILRDAETWLLSEVALGCMFYNEIHILKIF